jgi:hypothetical protein
MGRAGHSATGCHTAVSQEKVVNTRAHALFETLSCSKINSSNLTRGYNSNTRFDAPVYLQVAHFSSHVNTLTLCQLETVEIWYEYLFYLREIVKSF